MISGRTIAVPRRTLRHGIKFLVKYCVEFSRQYFRVKTGLQCEKKRTCRLHDLLQVINSSTGLQNFEKETRIIGLEEYDDEIEN
jgi:hypothetical protein